MLLEKDNKTPLLKFVNLEIVWQSIYACKLKQDDRHQGLLCFTLLEPRRLKKGGGDYFHYIVTSIKKEERKRPQLCLSTKTMKVLISSSAN